MAIRESGTLNTRLYTPYGPEVTSLQAFDESIASLMKTAREQHVTFVRVDPVGAITAADLQARGFKPLTYQQLQPDHTQVIDLRQSKDEIFADMSQNSRNITKNIHKKGVTIRKSTNPADITILTSLLAGVASRNHIRTHDERYFSLQAETLFPLGAATLFIAELEGTPIAAALVYDSDDTRTYAHAAADDAYRKLSAGTALLGAMILDAKECGLTTFDLYGITESDDPKHPWYGFTKFKKSFGGTPLAYVGTWDLPINKPGYWLYQTLARLMR
jgi:lipid II:glycine glycyltransferase (peptidoglycan interpeptide bridge formation enzyme)